MPSITVERHIAAPPDQVFAVATDFARAPERITGIRKIEMLGDAPVGLGTRFRETRVMLGREATEELVVTEFDPPRSYALGCESHGCRYHTELVFSPQGSGTDVKMVFEATPLTLLAKTMSALLTPMLGKLAEACGKDLDDLKSVIEAR